MGRKKKITIIILLLTVPLALGFKIFDVQLKGTDRDNPLVDLSAIIQLGGEYMSGESSSASKDPAKDAPTDSEQGKNGTSSDKEQNTKLSRTTVRVENRSVFINGNAIARGRFEQAFRNIHRAGSRVELIDDYAEYKTFLEIEQFFNSNTIVYTVSTAE